MVDSWEPVPNPQAETATYADGDFLAGGSVHLWAYPSRCVAGHSNRSVLPEWARQARDLDLSPVLQADSDQQQENALTWLGAELLISLYAGIAPAKVRLAARGTGRKPHLDPETHADCPLKFNLSHSGGWTLLALACGREVGVDLEKERVFREPLRFAKRFLHPTEVDYLQLIRRDARSEGLRRLWVRKEAAAKATGFGLPLGLASFSAVGEGSVPPGDWHELSLKKARAEGLCAWALQSLPDLPGLAACVCVEGAAADAPHLRFRQLPG